MDKVLQRGSVTKYVCIPQQRGLVIKHQNDIDRYYARNVINSMVISRSKMAVFDGWVCYAIDTHGYATVTE